MATKYFNGNVLTTTATALVAVGDVMVFEDSIGVCQTTSETGGVVTVDTEGVYQFPCEDTTDFALGARVTYDTVNEVITDDAVDATHINAGTIWETYAHATGDGFVFVKING